MLIKIESGLKRLYRFVSRREWIIRLLGLDRVDTNSVDGIHPVGLIMIQIDGLGREQFERAIQKGEMPFLKSLLETEHYQCHTMYSGLPSSTPAVQGELFYGVKGAVPAFGFRDKSSGQLQKMFEPAVAARVQKSLEAQGRGLLSGGSAYCNIYTGGATESHFCASSMGWSDLLAGVKRRNWVLVFLLNIPTFVRMVALLVVEFFLATIDVVRGLVAGKSFLPELKFIVSRVFVSVLLRDFMTLGASMDIARGLPVIHLNYLGYDEQSHRRGPGSSFAHWTLKGIDRCIKMLWRASHHYHNRHYEVWVYSDHGQEHTIPYVRLAGRYLQPVVDEVVAEVSGDISCVKSQPETYTTGTVHHRAQYLGENVLAKEFPPVGEDNQRRAFASTAAIGPVGHVYLDDKDKQFIDTVAQKLAIEHAIPAAVTLLSDDQLLAHTAKGTFQLPDQKQFVFGADHPFLTEVAVDLDRLCRHKDAGDIVLLGCTDGFPAVSFPMENGSHAGAGPHETRAFALMPEDTEIACQGGDTIRPATLYKTAMRILAQNDRTRTAHTTANEGNFSQINPVNSSIAAVTNDRELRLMTYNVHSCIGLDNKATPERIARVISRYNPDVIALQELDVSKNRSHGVNQAKRIAEILNMEYQFYPATVLDNELYGDAILSRLPMKLVKADVLPSISEKSESRGAIWVEIEVGGTETQIINTHLGLRPDEQLIQIEELLSDQWLAHPDCKGAVILCGDLNAVPGSRTLSKLSQAFENTQSVRNGKSIRTFASRAPVLPIDHIFANKSVTPVSVYVPNNSLTRVASDHLPLLASLKVDVIEAVEALDATKRIQV